jgi:hypothetical protein
MVPWSSPVFHLVPDVGLHLGLSPVRGMRQTEVGLKYVVEPQLELLWFGSDSIWDHDEDKPSNKTEWEEGVLKELHQRVGNAAADQDLDEDGDEEEEEDGSEEGFCFNDDDLFFFSEVAKTLARVTAQPNLPPEEVMATRRAIAALKKLPALTPEINVQIEVAHRVGDQGFSESCSCTINLDPEQIEISSGGSQYDPAVGSDSYGLEPFQWYATGGAERKGDRDRGLSGWLTR